MQFAPRDGVLEEIDLSVFVLVSSTHESSESLFMLPKEGRLALI